MYLVRLVYVSEVSERFVPEDIESILSAARKNNAPRDVTGLLCFNRKFFLQCLEGSRTHVNEVYHKILNDSRHRRIIMLDYREINAREFDRWSMGYMPESSLTKDINIRYSGSGTFEPYDMTGESAHLLMLALRDSVPTHK